MYIILIYNCTYQVLKLCHILNGLIIRFLKQ